MLVLGINDDAYDAGVTLVEGGRVRFAANEERYTRRKTQGGFPYESLRGCLRYTGVDPRDISQICVCGIMTPPVAKRMMPGIQGLLDGAKKSGAESVGSKVVDFLTHNTSIAHTTPDSLGPRLVKPSLPSIIRRILPPELRHAQIRVVEHHRAHAASAYYLSGFEEALVVTGDGMGDGVSLSVSRATPAGIERLWSASSRNSFGLFYEAITAAFGFIPCRHEGKVTGLAAMGDPTAVKVPPMFTYEGGELLYHGPRGRRATEWAREELVARYSREDISAWAQQQLEEHVVNITRQFLDRTGLKNVAVAGGIFANVKLNQFIHEADECEALFVCPNMGDGGLSLGAIAHAGFLDPTKVTDVFLGEDYSDDEVEQVLRTAGLPYMRHDDIDEHIADALADGKLVARFTGRMEWGPRALGNRTVMAPTTSRAIVDRLNGLLKRNDFMPFAPAALDEDMERYSMQWGSARHAAEFMTATFRCTDHMKATHPAVVHADDTARTQLVREETNPAFYRTLQAYKRRTGHGILLNTSFNVHEEPIVMTPQEAVKAFTNAKLDYLAAGPFLVPGAHLRSRAAGEDAAVRESPRP